jgi:hypothetical protein
MSSTTSRRTILAAAGALAAGSAANLAAVVVTKATDLDPIFAAIERRKKGWRAFSVAVTAEDELSGKPGHAEAEAEYRRAGDEAEEAAVAIADTRPTSLAGAVALLRFLADPEPDDEGQLGNLLTWGNGDEDGQLVFVSRIHSTLADALEKISAGA